MDDDPAKKTIEQTKLIEQKEGKGSDDSPTEWTLPSKLVEHKGGERSDDSPTELVSPPKMYNQEWSDYLTAKLERQLKMYNQEWSDYLTAKLERQLKMLDLELSDSETEELERTHKWMDQKGRKRYGDSTTKLAGPTKSKKLEGVLLHTRRLIVCDIFSYTSIKLRREGEKSGQDIALRGDAELKLHVVKWICTDDETHLELRHVRSFPDLISILAPLCPAVEHISIDLYRIHLYPCTRMPTPMRSVITVCIKSLIFNETLHKALLAVSKYFPNAKSLVMQMDSLRSPSDQAYFPEVNSSSSLRELKLRYGGKYSYDVTTDSLLMDIFTSCPNIVSLEFSGFERWLSKKSGRDITSCKMAYLTNIHLEPFETEYCYRYETFTDVLHVVHIVNVTSPCLKLVEAKKVQLGDAELASVKWSRISSGCELQLEGASAVVSMAYLKHLMSNELEGVTVLTFDGCNVDFPQRISRPPQSTGEESSLRELKFLNVECPLSQTDIHKLSETYPNVKVTVEHECQASPEVLQQGTGIPLKPERKTFQITPPSPTSSIDELVGAIARVQVHEKQTDTQNTEGEEKQDEEKEGKEEDDVAMESLPHVTGEENVTQIKIECRERVGVEGGKLQLDSFGIELEIPPGAIDSEAPQDISLRVLTNTPNLGNSKEEMSVCFGVQCLAPDDLVLKLPVIYTIPHCAVITRYSSVEAVLYTGEGEYSPDAVVKERIMLSKSGTPSCIITRDVLKLEINHFSWVKIRLRINNLFFRGKKMCCRPFKENNLALQKTPAILHAHLYDDIKGNSELVKSQEGEQEFVPAHMEQHVLIQAAEGELKMTCYVKETVIGGPAVVSFEKLIAGARICEPFVLDFPNQPDSVLVSLKVGQNKNLEVHLLFRLDFSTPHRIERVSLQDPEQLQGASSSQILPTSHRITGETLENITGGQEDFDDKLTTVAQKVAKREEIDNLGKALGFEPEDIQRYVNTNTKNPDVSYMGTLSMLRDWRKKKTKAEECGALKGVLKKAGQIRLADELFGIS